MAGLALHYSRYLISLPVLRPALKATQAEHTLTSRWMRFSPWRYASASSTPRSTCAIQASSKGELLIWS